MELYQLTIHELHDLIAKKEITSKEVTEPSTDGSREVDGKIGAYLLLTEEEAYRQAEEVDRKIVQRREDRRSGRYSHGTERYPLHEGNSDDLRV